MPVYEIEDSGATYEIDAADPTEALTALDDYKSMQGMGRGASSRGRVRNTPGKNETRAGLESELVSRQAASAEADADLRNAENVAGVVRPIAQTLTGLATGVVGLPAMVEEGVEGAVNLMGKARGREMPGLPRVFRGVTDFLNPDELAPQNEVEQLNATASNFLGGAVSGVGVGRELAERATGTVTRAVGQTLADNPGRQLVGAATGAASTETARAMGAGPVGQTIAGVVGSGAPMVGARPAGQAPVRNPRPFGAAVEEARRLDYPLMPSQVAAKAQDLADVGELGRRVPGTIRERFTSPAFEVQFAKDSQKITNRLAAKEIGMDGVTPVSLANAKAPHLAVYNEVVDALPVLRPDSELGLAADAIGEARRTNPLLRTTNAVEEVRDRLLMMENIPTQKALDAIRTYRKDAAKYYRQVDLRQGDTVAAEQAGDAYKAAADALEQAIDRQSSTLNPGLLERMRYARQQLAKIHNVEDAFDGFNVDPQAIASMAKRFPLTGYLLEIANVAKQFPDTNYLTTGAKYPKSSLVGALDSVSLALRKATGQETQNPSLLAREFQNRYGRADPNFDPRPAPPTPRPAPIVDYTPPDPNLPGGAPVGAPTQGGGGGLAATNLADDFQVLQPAEMRVGDLTAETPPMGGSLPADTLPPVPEGLSADFGLEVPPRRFSAGEDGILDEGLPFELDPEMASASIVRGGGEPGTVADSELLGQALLDAELRGRPLDPETGAGIAPEGVDRPFTRPAPGIGEDLAAGLEELLGGGPPRLGAPDAPDAPLGPSIIEGEFEDITGQNALPAPQRALPAPQKRLPPPPDEDLGAAMVEPEPPRGPQLPPQNPDAPTRPDGTVDLAEQQRRLESGPRFSREDVMAREDLEENTIAAREARATGTAGPRALGDELTVEDNVPRTEVADIADDGLKLENLPEQRPGDVGIKRTKRPPADIIPRKPLPPNPVVYYSGPARNPTRWLVMEEQGDTWILRSIDSTAFKKVNKDHTRPPGREMLTLVAKDAQEFGKRFDSDTDMTVEIIDAIERAVQDGALVVDDWDASIAAARAALEKSGGKRISRGEKGGEPWFKNIRPGR